MSDGYSVGDVCIMKIPGPDGVIVDAYVEITAPLMREKVDRIDAEGKTYTEEQTGHRVNILYIDDDYMWEGMQKLNSKFDFVFFGGLDYLELVQYLPERVSKLLEAKW